MTIEAKMKLASTSLTEEIAEWSNNTNTDEWKLFFNLDF